MRSFDLALFSVWHGLPSPHLISLHTMPPVCSPSLTFTTVSIGDCVMTESGPEMVTKVENVHSEGVYTIVTNKVHGLRSTFHAV